MWLVHWPASDYSIEFSLDYASIGDIFSNNYTCFFGNCNDYDWLTGNSTSCRLLRSVIILVIDKSDSRFSVVRFCKSSYVRDRILLHSVLLSLFMPKKIGDERYLLITSELGGKRTQVSVAPPPPQEEWKEG